MKRSVIVSTKKLADGAVRLILSDNPDVVRDPGNNRVFQIDSLWIDIGGVINQISVRDDNDKRELPDNAQPDDSFEHQLRRIMPLPIRRRKLGKTL